MAKGSDNFEAEKSPGGNLSSPYMDELFDVSDENEVRAKLESFESPYLGLFEEPSGDGTTDQELFESSADPQTELEEEYSVFDVEEEFDEDDELHEAELDEDQELHEVELEEDAEYLINEEGFDGEAFHEELDEEELSEDDEIAGEIDFEDEIAERKAIQGELKEEETLADEITDEGQAEDSYEFDNKFDGEYFDGVSSEREQGITKEGRDEEEQIGDEFEKMWAEEDEDEKEFNVEELSKAKVLAVSYDHEDSTGGFVQVKYPSGITLAGKSGFGAPGSTYYDPNHSGNPLLNIDRKSRSLELSKDFKVKEFITTRGKTFPKARIDPRLVEIIQYLRDYLEKPVRIISAYQSYRYRSKKNRPLKSQHLSGRAALISVRGMRGLEIGKAAISAVKVYANTLDCPNIGVYTGPLTVRIEVSEKFKFGSYAKTREKKFHERYKLLQHYQLTCELPKVIEDAIANDDLKKAVRLLIHYGIRDENVLTDKIFHSWWEVNRAIKRTDKAYTTKWISLRDTFVRPNLALPSPPVAQKAGVICLSKGERRIADPQPDSPIIDITGRYEAHYSNPDHGMNGYTFVVNQAGRHIEGGYAVVHKPSSRKIRKFHKIHGELQEDGSYAVYDRSIPHLQNQLILQKDKRTINWRFKFPGRNFSTTVFNRVSSSPTLLQNAILQFPNQQKLIKQSQLFPLTSKQINNLGGKLTRTSIIEVLKKYFKTEYGTKMRQKVYIGKAAMAVDGLIGDIFYDDYKGIHAGSNLELARFYARYFLSAQTWEFDSFKQSLLDWIQYMLNQVAEVEPGKRFDSINRYLGLTSNPGMVIGKKQNEYKIKLSVKKWGFFVVRYSGKIKIEKVNPPYWSPERKITFNVVFWSAGVDRGLGGELSIEGKAESHFDWQPRHIPGPFNIARLEFELGKKGVGASANAGFMQIHGAKYMPLLHGTFKEAEFGGDGIAFSGFSGFTGEIKSKSFPIKEFIRPLPKTDYAAEYEFKDDVHFCFNSALLTEDGWQALRIMCANELSGFMSPISILKITAHTDRVGKPKDNFVLSALRAANTVQAIEDILGNKFRIPPRKQEVTGKGETDAKTKKHVDGKPDRHDRRVDIELNGRSVLSLRAN